MGRGKGAGTGQPIWLKCPVERQTGWRYGGIGEHTLRRTGRTRGEKTRTEIEYGCVGRYFKRFQTEFVCSCGTTGWTRHHSAPNLPLVDEVTT